MIERLIKKAGRSSCRYMISAVAVDNKGNVLGYSFAHPRFCKYGGSVHAEMHLIRKYGKRISKIFIIRVNKSGHLLLIHPCSVCKKTADSLGIEIKNLFDAKLI